MENIQVAIQIMPNTEISFYQLAQSTDQLIDPRQIFDPSDIIDVPEFVDIFLEELMIQFEEDVLSPALDALIKGYLDIAENSWGNINAEPLSTHDVFMDALDAINLTTNPGLWDNTDFIEWIYDNIANVFIVTTDIGFVILNEPVVG